MSRSILVSASREAANIYEANGELAQAVRTNRRKLLRKVRMDAPGPKTQPLLWKVLDL